MAIQEIDISIIKGCIQKNSKYQELLYKQFYGFGMSISLRYAYSRDEAVEILNDSFLKVFENIHKFDTNNPFKPWFRRIIINKAIDFYRMNLKNQFLKDLKYADNELTDNDVISDLNVENIIAMLNQLPEIYRITFNLYEIEGFSHEEIAKMLNIAISTSRSNLTRAKKILRSLVQPHFKEKYAEVI